MTLPVIEQPSGSPEVWAGIECTVNRVGDQYFDQLAWNGHAARIEDLDLIADLGVRTVRYPILWERIEQPDGAYDWDWADARLERLRALGIRPIVGLLHHGSGPRHTSLLDPLFPQKLAVYARALAERYPWVDAYTPVNEPLTTARFSGLYGFWYPHARDDESFARALRNQVLGSQLAMQAVRAVNPGAQLIQTEDLGKIFSTPALAYQADFENERRWLSIDLLAGRVDPHHPLYGYLRWAGLSEEEIAMMCRLPTPPDVFGVNYYITSERFLDERLERYPAHTHGGNGQHAYADVEAVRVCTDAPAGLAALLGEAWQRYGLPLAVTEVHLGAPRGDQLHWVADAWRAVQQARAAGADVRALTAWSLLGTYNWNSLVTRDEGAYEPGLFDVRAGGQPRPTALAAAWRALIAGGQFDHPVLDASGWWQRPARLLFAPLRRTGEDAREADYRPVSAPAKPRRLALISGATGTLGRAFARICAERDLPALALTHAELDISDPADVQAAIERLRPWAVINTAGYVRVDQAEQEPERCYAANTAGAAALAEACARTGAKLLTFSSDLVFDGLRDQPYLESCPTAPLNVYGASKAAAEARVLAALPGALVVRTSAFFGPWDTANFAHAVLRAAEAGEPFAAADDLYVSPTYVPDLVQACLDLLIDGAAGIWHLANAGAVTWYHFARQVLAESGRSADFLAPRPAADLGWPAPRPRYSVLGSEQAQILPPLESAVWRYTREA